jgi:hypothetical protein
MKAGLIASTVVATLVFGATLASPASAAWRAPHDPAVSSAETTSDISVLQNKGRYKKQGDECVWDANDGGPSQCTPVTRGRFKRGGDDSCTWDSNDTGPDQCKPREGRWKKGDGDRCYWDPKDSGANQCNPRQARK